MLRSSPLNNLPVSAVARTRETHGKRDAHRAEQGAHGLPAINIVLAVAEEEGLVVRAYREAHRKSRHGWPSPHGLVHPDGNSGCVAILTASEGSAQGAAALQHRATAQWSVGCLLAPGRCLFPIGAPPSIPPLAFRVGLDYYSR